MVKVATRGFCCVAKAAVEATPIGALLPEGFWDDFDYDKLDKLAADVFGSAKDGGATKLKYTDKQEEDIKNKNRYDKPQDCLGAKINVYVEGFAKMAGSHVLQILVDEAIGIAAAAIVANPVAFALGAIAVTVGAGVVIWVLFKDTE